LIVFISVTNIILYLLYIMKLLGISSGKIASVAFLLVTLFLALALSSVDFLKTSNAAEVPVFHEGMDEKKKEGMYGKKKEGMEEEEEGMEEEEKKGMEDEEPVEEEEGQVEGFEVGSQSLPFSPLYEAFGAKKMQ
jgi:hypothetical protein